MWIKYLSHFFLTFEKRYINLINNIIGKGSKYFGEFTSENICEMLKDFIISDFKKMPSVLQ